MSISVPTADQFKTIQFKAIYSLLIMGISLSACVSSPSKPPVWVDAPSKTYSSDRYLSAVGQASDFQAAQDRALANLAKFFEVSVSDNAMDFSRSQVTRNQVDQDVAPLRTVKTEQAATRYVTAFAQEVLEGAEISQHWKSPEGQHYAVATMNKASVATRFKQALSRCDQMSSAAVSNIHSQSSLVLTLSALEQARQAQHECSKHNRNLILVTGKPWQPRYTESELAQQIRGVLSQQRIQTQSDDEHTQNLLISGLSVMGVKPALNTTKKIVAVLDLEPISQKQGWYWQKGGLVLSLYESGKLQSSQRWPLKLSAMESAQVIQRLKQQLDQKMGNYVYQMLTRGAEPPK